MYLMYFSYYIQSSNLTWSHTWRFLNILLDDTLSIFWRSESLTIVFVKTLNSSFKTGKVSDQIVRLKLKGLYSIKYPLPDQLNFHLRPKTTIPTLTIDFSTELP